MQTTPVDPVDKALDAIVRRTAAVLDAVEGDAPDGEPLSELHQWAGELLGSDDRRRELRRLADRGVDVPGVLGLVAAVVAAPHLFEDALMGVATPPGPQRGRLRDIDAEVDVLERHAEDHGAMAGLGEMRALQWVLRELGELARAGELGTVAGKRPDGAFAVRADGLYVVDPEVSAERGAGRRPGVAENVFLLIVAGHFQSVFGEVDVPAIALFLADALELEICAVADSRRSFRQRLHRLWDEPGVYRQRAVVLGERLGLAVELPPE